MVINPAVGTDFVPDAAALSTLPPSNAFIIAIMKNLFDVLFQVKYFHYLCHEYLTIKVFAYVTEQRVTCCATDI
jgi:hypothetical protein